MNKKMIVAIMAVMVGNIGVIFAGENEAKYPLTAYPAGYELKSGPGSDLSVVDVDGGKALQFKSADFTHIRIRSPFQKLKPDTKYVLSYQVKVADFKTKKGKHPDGVMVVIRSKTNKPYNWANVTGSGSTDGWVTAYIPFDTGADPAYVKSRVEVFFTHISGTVLLRNLKIEAVNPEQYPSGRYFMVGKDKVSRGLLKL